MALTNPKKFGLEVQRALADVVTPRVALRNLNISPFDLEVIHKSSVANPAVDFDDFRSLSRLTSPIWKTLDRFQSDSNQYGSLLINRAGTDNILFGGLKINGKLSGAAIRYRYLEGSGASAVTKIADISTSRVSAWSSAVPEPIPATAPISYGSQISVRSGGQLKFGTQSGSGLATGPRLKTTIVPTSRRFASEIPTSKIKCKINGVDVEFYAMKGIPCIFEGYFRNISGSCEFASISGQSGLTPSWLIVEQSNRNNQTEFKDLKSFNFNSVRSRERFIELYYPPDKITQLNLSNIGISVLPSSKFDILTRFYMTNTGSMGLKNFPDFKSMTPIVEVLHINSNYFNLGEEPTERKLNSNITAKIPNTITDLQMGGTFYGSIQQNIFKGTDYPNLTSFSLARGPGPYFHPDSDDTTPNSCTLPNVNDTVTNYNVSGNDFRKFDTTNSSIKAYNAKDLPNLLTLSLSSNYYLTDSTFTQPLASNVITSLNIYNTGLPCPNMANKASFSALTADYTRNFGTLFANESGGVYTGYKFEGCINLTQLSISHSGLSGPFPEFDNPGMTSINFNYTSISGGDPSINGGGNFVIPLNTFKSCPNISSINILSGNLLKKPIHEDAFTDATELTYLRVYSYKRVTGNIPKLNSCTKLTQVNLHYNNMDGNIPNFSSSPNIAYIYLHENNFTGNIPKFQNLSSLYHLYLQSNNFTGLLEFVNLPNLDRFYCHNNSISGEIPDFTECPKLRYLAMYNNNFTSYKSGAFKDLNRVRYIDCSLNNLTQTSVNEIVDDLYDNYTAVPRGGVTINIKNNVGIGASLPTLPSEDQIDKINILKTKGWNFVYF